MIVRAKFVCEQPPTPSDVRLRAVYAGSPENDKFFEYTPAGYISMSVVSPTVQAEFEPGVEYYVEFRRADEAPFVGS